MKKLAFLITFLVFIGISLTLLLPPFGANNIVPNTKNNYQLNQASLKEPILLSETSLKIEMDENDYYGLQLGIFSQLKQAIAMAENNLLVDDSVIIKMKDNNRYWYILVNGPYPNKDTINQLKMHSTSTLIKWPLSHKIANDKNN